MSRTALIPAHDRYRAQLEAAQSDDLIVASIEADPGAPEWWPRGRPVRRTYGRFVADAAPYLTIVFETLDGPQAVVGVEAFEKPPPESRGVIRAEPFGWLRVSPAASDPTLPSLVGLMGLPGSQMVRYRPGQRCVVRVDDGDRTVWAKTFADDRGEVVHQNDLLLWQHRSELGFAVAPPGRYDAATRTLWNDHVHGEPVKQTLKGEQGPALAERMGRACGSIPTSALAPTQTHSAAVELERTAIRAARLAAVVPALAGPLDEFLHLLGPALRATSRREPRPIHGAPHHEQWLATDSGLGLVDFDRMGVGDPELDVATFQAEIDFEGGIAAGADQISLAFLEGYEETAGPLDRRLLAGYRALKRMHKAARTGQAIRADGGERTAVHLQRALDAFA